VLEIILPLIEYERNYKKTWNYILYQQNNDYFLSVTCGSVALYDVVIRQTNDEKNNYIIKGVDFIDTLAKTISSSPNYFKERHIPEFNNLQ